MSWEFAAIYVKELFYSFFQCVKGGCMFYHEHVHHKIRTTIFSSIFKCLKGGCLCYHEHLQQKIWTTIFKCLKGGCVSWLEAVSYPLLFTLLNGFSLAHTPAYCSIYPLHSFKVLPIDVPFIHCISFTFYLWLFTVYSLLFTLLNGFSLGHTSAYVSGSHSYQHWI